MRSRALTHVPKPVAEDLRRVGTLIREARAQRGFTQEELARRLRISRTTIIAAEQGDPSVTAGILVSLLWVLGIGPVNANLTSRPRELAHPQSKRRVRTRKSPDDF
jgi:transcriptional regulator with XRE-family HTH domain